MLSQLVASKLGVAAPVIDQRLTALRADNEDLYDSVLALRERILAIAADIEAIAAIARPAPTPDPTVARVPAAGFVLVGAESIRAMPVTKLQEYCARSVDVEPESARDYVRENSRFREAFGVDTVSWTKDGYHVNPLMWRWLASRPADQPGDWPTNYALVRSLTKAAAMAFLREAELE